MWSFFVESQDPIVSGIEDKLSTWTFLPKGNLNNLNGFYSDLSVSQAQVTRNLNSSWVSWKFFQNILLFLNSSLCGHREWGRPSSIEIWARSEIWCSLWLLSRQSQYRPWWTPHSNSSPVSIQCHKGWRNCFPRCTGLFFQTKPSVSAYIPTMATLYWFYIYMDK